MTRLICVMPLRAAGNALPGEAPRALRLAHGISGAPKAGRLVIVRARDL